MRGDLISVYDVLMRSGEGGADLFSVVSGERRGGNDLKLHQGKIRLDIWKKFFTERMSNTETSSPGEQPWPQTCQCSRRSWTTLLDIRFNF